MTPQSTSDFKRLQKKLDKLEAEIHEVVRSHVNSPRKEKWTVETESLMARLATMGAWVYDYIHGNACKPDPVSEVYMRSKLRKVRRALGFSE